MNGANYGQGSTFNASESALALNIEKEIKKYPAPRIELIKRIGGFDQPVQSHKIEWSLRDERPVKALLAVAYTANGTTMIVDTPGVFNVDDILRTATGQQLVVEAVSGGIQLTVRNLAGTPANVDFGTTVQRIGMATPQGKLADDMVISGLEDLYNYTSILEDVVHLSGTQNEALIRGLENSGQLIARKQRELLEIWQSQMVLGIRTKNDILKTTTSGGIKYLIDTYAPDNAIDAGGSTIWDSTGDDGIIGVIDDALDGLSAKVMEKPVMLVGGGFMRKFKYTVNDDNVQATNEKMGVKGTGRVGTYMSHLYGPVDVILLQERTGWMDEFVFLVDESDIGEKAMQGREWQTFPLGRDGDRFRWQVLSERTVKIGNPAAAAYIYNF